MEVIFVSFWWPGLFAKSEQKGELHRLVPWIRMTGAYRNAETQREDGEVAEIPDADLDIFFFEMYWNDPCEGWNPDVLFDFLLIWSFKDCLGSFKQWQSLKLDTLVLLGTPRKDLPRMLNMWHPKANSMNKKPWHCDVWKACSAGQAGIAKWWTLDLEKDRWRFFWFTENPQRSCKLLGKQELMKQICPTFPYISWSCKKSTRQLFEQRLASFKLIWGCHLTGQYLRCTIGCDHETTWAREPKVYTVCAQPQMSFMDLFEHTFLEP